MSANGPEIFVLSGPNGAGKTTAASVLLPEQLGVQQFVNADLIAKGLSPFAPQRAAFTAGRLMLERIHDLRRRRESFGFETTLASRSYVPFLGEAQEAGYAVHLIYVWLPSVDLALSRIRARVEQGGHDVPASDVRRRYHRGLRNLFNLYMPLCDTWTVLDNSDRELITVARAGWAQEPRVFDPDRWAALRSAADDPAQ